MRIEAEPLDGLGEIVAGDDLGALIVAALARPLEDGNVVVVAHKAVSKAEGRVRRLADVKPSPEAVRLAGPMKDARQVQVVLEESDEVLRAVGDVLVCVTRHGFVCANAGVDASNAPEGCVVLLPEAPDASARRLRAQLRERTGVTSGVVITDSFGRAWRLGQCDVAIGCAGLAPLEDWRGRPDANGRTMNATWIAVADELAAAADLARGKDGGRPVVLVRGADRHVTADDGPGARALLRPAAEDLFR